ncbi:MAG: ATP-binding cassette domain-containing protein [Pseudomonadota bacterium]
MERNIFKYIWHHSRADQIAILILVLVSMPFYFMSLDIPKSIVNKGIQGQGFVGVGSTQSFMAFDLPFGETLFGEKVTLFSGFDLEQQGLLLALSFTFLALVLINGLFKFVINTQKGRLGERMLRRLRYELSDRILRFPVLQIRRVKQAEMATMIKDEVEPLGGFIGDAFVTPAFLGGQAITALVFIIVQSAWLGLIAAAIVLVQAVLIPRLRRRILILGRERQLTARQLAGRIGELVDGAVEIQANDTSNWERSDITARLGRIFKIRYEIYQRKFFVKFLNNLLAQFTPFIFYAGGGLLALQGQLDIGALVAVIAAYKDLPGPVKELIDWDQRRADVQIKYDQVIEQFQPPVLIDPDAQSIDNDPGPPLTGEIVMQGVVLVDESDFKLLESVSFTCEANQHVAVVGPSGSGKEQVALLLAGLIAPSNGSVKIDGREVTEMPSAVTGRRLAYVGQETYHFPLSVRENLVYGLKHVPIILPDYEGKAAHDHAREIAEDKRAGNPTFDANADWIDYQSAGVDGPADMTELLIEVLKLVELEEDTYRFGLTGTVDPVENPDVSQAILTAREALLALLEEGGHDDLVVRFSTQDYNGNASLAENILFGTPTQDSFGNEALASNPLFLSVLDEAGLTRDLEKMGLSIAKTMVEIFADLPAGHPFFDQFSFISDDDLPDFRSLVSKGESAGLDALSKEDLRRLLGLPLEYVEARHRLGLIDQGMEQRLLAARRSFADRLEAENPGAVEFYRGDTYNAAASLQDNILFGRVAYGKAQAEEIVGQAITKVLDDLGLRQTVMEIGLNYYVGVGGKRLNAVQRQKLGLARAILKQPDILIVNEALSVMDGATQDRLLERVLDHRSQQGVMWTLQRPSKAEDFQRLVVLRGGRVMEQGSYEELDQPGTVFSELKAAE